MKKIGLLLALISSLKNVAQPIDFNLQQWRQQQIKTQQKGMYVLGGGLLQTLAVAPITPQTPAEAPSIFTG